MLEPVHDGLPEHAVLVPDAVPPGGQVQPGHGVQKARGQAAQAAVAQRRVALLLRQGLEVVTGGKRVRMVVSDATDGRGGQRWVSETRMVVEVGGRCGEAWGR